MITLDEMVCLDLDSVLLGSEKPDVVDLGEGGGVVLLLGLLEKSDPLPLLGLVHTVLGGAVALSRGELVAVLARHSLGSSDELKFLCSAVVMAAIQQTCDSAGSLFPECRNVHWPARHFPGMERATREEVAHFKNCQGC